MVKILETRLLALRQQPLALNLLCFVLATGSVRAVPAASVS